MNHRFIIILFAIFILYGCPARYDIRVDNLTQETIKFKLGYALGENQMKYGVPDPKVYSIDANTHYRKVFRSFSISYKVINHELKPIYILSDSLDTVKTVRMSFSYLANCGFRLVFPVESMSDIEQQIDNNEYDYYKTQKLFNEDHFLECSELIKKNLKILNDTTKVNLNELDSVDAWRFHGKKRGLLVMGIICASRLESKQDILDYIDKIKKQYPEYWKILLERDNEIIKIKIAVANNGS